MNYKVFFQLTAPAIVTGLVLVGATFGSAWSIHRLQVNLGSILRESVTSLHASQDLENSTLRMRYHALLYLIRPAPETLKQIQEDEDFFEAAFTMAELAAYSPVEQAYLEQIGSGFAQYKEEMARLRDEIARTGPQTDFAQLSQQHPIRHITTPCRELGQFNLEQLEKTASESNNLSSRSRVVLLMLGLAGPLGGMIVGYGITRGLTRSLSKLRVRVREVYDRLQPLEGAANDGIQFTVTADGDLSAMNQQLDQLVHRAEEMMHRLQTQQREILRAEQLASLGQLAAGVAHEIRNPLTGIKLLVEAALRPRRPRSLTQEDLEFIHGEIARLEATVRHFLDFARPPTLMRRCLDLRDLIPRPLELVRVRARQQGVRLQVVLPKEPLFVHLDADQLANVLINLLINALDALPNGGEITIEIARLTGDPPRCVLSVHDNGPGIAPDMLPHLFTPFATAKPSGTGLGLSLARRVVEQHGGCIHASNDPSGGARFCIELPLTAGTEVTCPGSC